MIRTILEGRMSQFYIQLFFEAPIYLHLIFAILQFEISSLMSPLRTKHVSVDMSLMNWNFS